jgi:spoIIIJ-associated protein
MSLDETLDEATSIDPEEEEEMYSEEEMDEADEVDEDQDDSSEDEAEEQEEAPEAELYSKTPTLTDDELDQVADTAIETLRGLLGFFDAGEATIDEYEGEDGELILDVVGEDLAVLIGRYGRTLDALQFIVASVVNKKIGFRYPIIVDIEGYRHRRRQKLESIAKSSAARCIRSGSDVHLRAMTPYERRIIHIILRNERRVSTESEGEEPNRCVVVKYKKR